MAYKEEGMSRCSVLSWHLDLSYFVWRAAYIYIFVFVQMKFGENSIHVESRTRRMVIQKLLTFSYFSLLEKTSDLIGRLPSNSFFTNLCRRKPMKQENPINRNTYFTFGTQTGWHSGKNLL